VSEWRTTCG